MTLEEALRTHDMDEIVDSMTAYAYSRMSTIEWKNLEGKTPDDFVSEVLMKVANGDRDWAKANCSFREFLFGSLRSHISNFLSNYKPNHRSEVPENEVLSSGSEVEIKNEAIELLKAEGASVDELDVFECWADGLIKPAEIAQNLSKDVKDINNTVKRLLRKMPILRSKMKHLI